MQNPFLQLNQPTKMDTTNGFLPEEEANSEEVLSRNAQKSILAFYRPNTREVREFNAMYGVFIKALEEQK